MIRYATDETFYEMIREGLVIVDFFGKTCQPCKMLAIELEDMEEEMPFLNIVKVDIDECPQIAKKYEINGIPDVYFYMNNEEVAHEIGLISEDDLLSIIQKHLYN